MSSHGEQGHLVRRMVLPSGRTLEVVDSKGAESPVHANEAEPQAPQQPPAVGAFRRNMAEQIERFVRALEADAILPEDF
jgi:hypothetical protein